LVCKKVYYEKNVLIKTVLIELRVLIRCDNHVGRGRVGSYQFIYYIFYIFDIFRLDCRSFDFESGRINLIFKKIWLDRIQIRTERTSFFGSDRFCHHWFWWSVYETMPTWFHFDFTSTFLMVCRVVAGDGETKLFLFMFSNILFFL
jgi:hypothetical protein